MLDALGADRALTQLEHGWLCKACLDEVLEQRQCVMCGKAYEEDDVDDREGKNTAALTNIRMAKLTGGL